MPTPAASDLPDQPHFSSKAFRTALSHFATGVTIVTTRDPQGAPVGLTVTSFNSVSLTPPLVLWSLAKSAGSLAAFTACTHYAIHVLNAEQRHLAEIFASKQQDRWQGLAFTPGLDGTPLLPGVAATFECTNRSRYDEGDHFIFVGQVLRCTQQSQAHATPLLFYGGTLQQAHFL